MHIKYNNLPLVQILVIHMGRIEKYSCVTWLVGHALAEIFLLCVSVMVLCLVLQNAVFWWY